MIPVLEILRMEESKEGSLGALRIGKELFCTTLEPPDELNEVGISSIPVGQYVCKRYSSTKYPDTWEIIGVPGRTKVLFHAGNVVEDTRGCVILGQYWGKLREHRAVLNSGKTFEAFKELLLPYDELHLTIREEY